MDQEEEEENLFVLEIRAKSARSSKSTSGKRRYQLRFFPRSVKAIW